MKHTLLIGVVAGALAVVPATAQSPSSSQPPAGAKPNPTATHKPATAVDKQTASSTVAAADRAFVKEAAIGGMAEVELGTIAKEKASNADVKQFADRMATRHSKANDELEQWATQKSVTLP